VDENAKSDGLRAEGAANGDGKSEHSCLCRRAL
jgi:hypothetical protein